VASHAAGRHRAPGRYNPLSELTGLVAKSTRPFLKTSAVIATSGGLVASFALPASAGPLARSAHPASGTSASTTAAPVAVRAPEVPAPAAGAAFGVVGFTATPKPKPKPKPAPRPVVREAPERAPATSTARSTAVSRSTSRSYVGLKPAAGGVLAIAAQYEGLMYSYGGTTPETGFDCSGFTSWVFGKVGISLPRTAEQQRQAATPVSDPQPGDLVFFGAPAYHVGIYAGGGMMWDSPRSGKAVAKRAIWSSSATYGRP
jgi:cell wall-associated NlpC family hydrolase